MLVPRHIAIIMDGNNRWAKRKKLPAVSGHRAGVKALRRVIDSALELGIEYLTLYAFSVDNWKRSPKEVDSLMNLMRKFLHKDEKQLKDKGVRLIVIGRKDRVPDDILKKVDDLTAETADNHKLKLVIAFNYGARSEIVDAAAKIINDVLKGKLKAGDIDEEGFGSYLYTAGIPDPDMLIRTSGEMRLSNFLLWQISYTELWVTPVLWPDFGKKDLIAAVKELNHRQRRYGGRKNGD